MGLKLNDVAPLTGESVEQATAAPGEKRGVPILSDVDIERIVARVVDEVRKMMHLQGAR